MVQKKVQHNHSKQAVSTEKTPTAVQVAGTNPVPVAPFSERVKGNYPVISFILALLVLYIYFSVGKMFMELAVNENFCSIRQMDDSPKTGVIVAMVDGEPVYMSEVEEYGKTIPQLADVPFEMVYPKLLNAVVELKALTKSAEDSQVSELPAVKQAIKAAYQQIIVQAYMDQELKKLATDDRLKELYEQEKTKFKPVDEVHAKHILVKTEREARDVLIRLRAGADFALMVEKYSQDKSSPNGDLGYFTESMMIPEFGKVVFAMNVGDISEPIKTPFGWHVVVVDDKRQSEMPAFDDIKPDLQRVLMAKDARTVVETEKKRRNVDIKKPTL